MNITNKPEKDVQITLSITLSRYFSKCFGINSHHKIQQISKFFTSFKENCPSRHNTREIVFLNCQIKTQNRCHFSPMTTNIISSEVFNTGNCRQLC